MRVLAVILVSLLSACASQGPIHLYEGPERSTDQLLTIDVPMELDVVRINQRRDSRANRLLSYEGRSLLLLPGDYQIEAFYKNVFDLDGGGHQVVKSEPVVFRINGNAGEHYRLDFVRPEDLEQARSLARDFRGWSIRVDDQKRQDTHTVGQAVGQIAETVYEQPTAPSAGHYMDLLKAGWRQATAEERRDFLRWIAEQE